MCYFLIYLGNRIDIKKYQVISSGNKSSKSRKSNKSEAKELQYSDGTYVGEIHNFLPHGLGKYYYNTGEMYIGNFEQGNCSGYGSHYDTLGHLQYCSLNSTKSTTPSWSINNDNDNENKRTQ